MKKVLPPTQDKAHAASYQGLQFFNQLFAVERELKDKASRERFSARVERSKPILDTYLSRLLEQQGRLF